MTADSHPDTPAEERDAKNALKFSLNYFQVRLSELQTVSNVIKLQKQLLKSGTQLILQDSAYETYNTELVDICFGVGGACNMGSLQKFDRLSKVYRGIEILKER